MAKAIPWRSWIFTPGDHGNYQPAYVPGRIMSNHPPGPTLKNIASGKRLHTHGKTTMLLIKGYFNG